MARTQMSFLVCGNYGYRTNQIDGQSMKTRVLKEAFANVMGEANVRSIDSSFFPRSPIRFLYEVRKGFKECTHVFMLPGRRGLQVFLPLFLRWKRLFGRSLRYVVIGGWLPDLLTEKHWLLGLSSKLDGIYVETDSMAKKLSDLGIFRVNVLPNFRNFDQNMIRKYSPTTNPIKLVFYSRITKTKGIEFAAAAVDRLNAGNTSTPRAVLDVFGPIMQDYQDDFQNLLSCSPYVHYKGILAENTYSVLQQYDLMLFPTFYEGEGFPGAIIDAFIAGLPVVASDWKYNREIVDQGKTGAICQPKSVDDLVAKVEQLVACPTRIMEMRQQCIAKANEFHSANVIQQLLSDMGVKS